MKPVRAAAAAVLAVAAFGAPASTEVIAIDHQAPGCVLAERFPKLVACFRPASRLTRARVYFRARGTREWHFVEMVSDAPCHVAVLPKPQRATTSLDYYVEVVEGTSSVRLTAEYHPRVVAGHDACPAGRVVAPTIAKASVAVGALDEAPAFPEGFVGGGRPTGTVSQK